ncbi:YihY/virulence factor BrkB family protein [Rhizobium sp. CC-YZS058]|uniref:YihY/virulence factor BrkB family protein n=1 Tax=Rhizobium sp. CC-YZS058 TaxID=3042153 RepID=UPI002B05C2FC|nr:YihY/virulence factor BrkB family protein [Rhizobium sp. CC-YZS058]MEA3533818.1 YihY/virulence factor BrkB family protein [Rhizobium sp. CC-YZS058]
MPSYLSVAWKVVFDAIWHFSDDDGWAMASHVALSSLLAVFPFLIFGTALGSFLGADQFAETAVHLIFDTWPPSIARPLADEIVQVLTIPRGGLLTLSVLAAAYFASNGVEALRVSLNRAYRVAESRAWYMTRLASLGFVLAGTIVLASVSIVLVVVPLALRYADRWLPWLDELMAVVANWSAVLALLVLTAGLIISHLYLPDGRRKIMDVLPGVLVTLIAWSIGAYAFASYLSTFANYVSTYAGLASIMIVLVFLYMAGAIFIIGAEINAAIMKYKVKRMVISHFRGARGAPSPAAAETVAEEKAAEQVAEVAVAKAQDAELDEKEAAKLVR